MGRSGAWPGSESGDRLDAYPAALRSSCVAKELKLVRNAEPAVARWGGTFGTLYSGLDMWLGYLGLSYYQENRSR